MTAVTFTVQRAGHRPAISGHGTEEVSLRLEPGGCHVFTPQPGGRAQPAAAPDPARIS